LFFSQKFRVSAIRMRSMGVFNPKVGSDSKLFVDTKLIDTAGEEFEKSTAQLTKYFGQIVTLFKLSKKKKDMPWTAAWKRMQSKETSNTAIGFSKSGTDGNGIGPVLAEKICSVLKRYFRMLILTRISLS
jgi:hypothetical protein